MHGLFQNELVQLALKVVLTGGVALIVIVLSGLFIAGLQRLFRVTVERVHTIYIKNLGNVPSVYHLNVEALEPKIKFQFFQNEIPLTEVAVPIEPLPVATTVQKPVAVPETGRVATTTVAPGKTLSAQNSAQSKMAVQGATSVQGAAKSAEKVVAKTGALASLMGTIGGLLPGSLGKSLKEQSAIVREAQSKTKDIAQKPQELQRKVDQMQKDSGKLGVKNPGASLQAVGQAGGEPVSSYSTGQAQSVNSVHTPAIAQAHSAASTPLHSAAVQTMKCYRTSEAGPEETLQLTLRINSKSKIVPEGSFLYTVKSQQVPLEKFDKEIAPLSRQGVVHFGHVGSWHYWLPNLLSVLLVLTGLLTIGYSIYRIWL